MTEEHLYKSIEYEKEIDDIRNQFIDLSRERLSKGSNPKAELLFLDIVKHLEHIGDFL
jgi:phosphate:Na+ symporter